jgi:hypothetical protein
MKKWPHEYTAAMFDAFAAMDRAAMFRVASAHKDKARCQLRELPVVMTNRAYRIVDRWFRRVAYRAPNDLGKFIHGATHEEPKKYPPTVIHLGGPSHD